MLPWRGYDTETQDGRAVLACTDERALHLTGAPIPTADLFDFLLSHGDGQRFATWNLDYDVQATIAGLPPAVLGKLSAEGFAEWNGYALHYLAGKEFTLARGKGRARVKIALYDGFPHLQIGLARAAEKYLPGERKQELPDKWILEMSACLAATPAPGSIERANTVIQYCRNDARLAKLLMEMLDASYTACGVPFDRPLSPGYLAGGKLHASRVPPIPEGLERECHASYYGGHVEILERGRIGPCVGYDLSSAYPSVMADMPTLDAVERTDRYSSDATYGSYLVRVSLPPSAPILPYRPRAGSTILFPVGSWIDWYPRPLVDLIPLVGGEVEVLGAVEGYSRDGRKLWPEIPDWYAERKRDPKGIRSLALKLLLNSAYGKLAETRSKTYRFEGALRTTDLVNPHDDGGGFYRSFAVGGRYTNFLLAGHVTGATQARAMRAAYLEGGRPVMVATDGILFRRDPAAPVPKLEKHGAGLGSWEGPSRWSDAIIVGCGYYGLRDPETGAWTTKTRGAEGGSRVVSDPDFRALFSGSGRTLSVPALRGSSLRECARRGDFSDLNVLREIAQSKDVNADTKRDWSKRFASVASCLAERHTSEPWVVWESPEESLTRLTKQGRAGILPSILSRSRTVAIAGRKRRRKQT